jgi:TolB protein
MVRFIFAVFIFLNGGLLSAEPIRITITQGVIEPMPVALPVFIAETPNAVEVARNLTGVVRNDLIGTGLFREIPRSAHVSKITSFSSPVQFSDWQVINADALITGSVSVDNSGKVTVMFRVYDVFSQQELGSGLRFSGSANSWRRIAHKVADEVYSRITGETGYFDSRIVFVSETGGKAQRRKRLALMDYDGANVKYLTDSNAIVMAPRFSPKGDQVLYTSYASGFPQVQILNVGNVRSKPLISQAGTMTFAPRFSPNGKTVLYSLENGGNVDIYRMQLSNGAVKRLTRSPAIETAPSFSPDGKQVVFESDRSGSQQLYIMSANGGDARRISFGSGRYGTPVWSPRGDMIAFTKQSKGRFHIGVMRLDGSEERLLTASFLDEGPTWSPNGRVIVFTRSTQGRNGTSSLYSVDISGRNLKPLITPEGASDPSWSPLAR